MREIFDYIAKEWGVLKTAPFSFIGLSILCVVGGVALASWHYSERISTADAQVAAKDAEVGRYRVALGIDKASRGAMVELSNEELLAMANNIVPKIRDLCASFKKQASTYPKPPANPKDKAAVEKLAGGISGASSPW